MTQPGPDGHLAPPIDPGPAHPGAPAGPTRDRVRPVVALGVAMLATAVVLAMVHGREDGDLVGPLLAVGVHATAGLLALAAGAHLLGRGGHPDDVATDLVAWPGAVGSVSVGLMIVLVLDDAEITPYLAGLVVLALSVLGLVRTGRGPFVVTAVLAAAVVFIPAVDDVWQLSDTEGGPHTIGAALGLTAFALLVTAAGWPFPIRAVSGVAAGAVTVLGFVWLTMTLAFEASFQASFSSSQSSWLEPEPEAQSGADWSMMVPEVEDFGRDGWTVLALAALLTLFWTGCAMVTGHQGFRLLVVAMVVAITPLVLVVLQTTDPARWAAGLALGGGALLVAVAVAWRWRSATAGPGI